MPDIQEITRRYIHLLHSSPQVKENFPSKSDFPAYRRTKNLKEILATSKFRSTVTRRVKNRDVVLDVAKDVTFVRIPYFKLPKCNSRYVGSTSTELKVRSRNHKSSVLNNRRTRELVVHNNSSEHDIAQISFIVIKQISQFQLSISRPTVTY